MPDSSRSRAVAPEPLPDDYLDKVAEGQHEDVINILHSIKADNAAVYLAKLPNRGWVPNLPDDVMFEGPTRAAAAGLMLTAQPPLPSGVAGTLATRFHWVEIAV